MNGQDQKNTKLMVQIYISTVWQNDPFFILCFIHKGNRANAKIIPLALSGHINTSEKRAKLNFSQVYILILIANIIYGEKKKGCITNRENKVFYKGFSRQMPLKSSLYFFLLVFSFTICSILPTKDSNLSREDALLLKLDSIDCIRASIEVSKCSFMDSRLLMTLLQKNPQPARIKLQWCCRGSTNVPIGLAHPSPIHMDAQCKRGRECTHICG